MGEEIIMVDVIAKTQSDPFEGLEEYILDDEKKDQDIQEEEQEEQKETQKTKEGSETLKNDAFDIDSLISDDNFQEMAPKSKIGGMLTDISGHIMSAVWKLSPSEEEEFIIRLRKGVEPLLGLLAIDDIVGTFPFKKIKPMTRLMIAIGIVVLFGIMYKPRHEPQYQLIQPQTEETKSEEEKKEEVE